MELDRVTVKRTTGRAQFTDASCKGIFYDTLSDEFRYSSFFAVCCFFCLSYNFKQGKKGGTF